MLEGDKSKSHLPRCSLSKCLLACADRCNTWCVPLCCGVLIPEGQGSMSMFIFMNVLLCKLCGTGRDNHGPGLRTLVFHSAAPSKVHDVNKKTSFSEPIPRSSVLIHGWRMMIFTSCSSDEV